MTDPPTDRNGETDESAPTTAEDGSLSGFELTVEELPDLVSVHAVSLLDRDGHIVRWVERSTEPTGCDEDAVVGTHYREFFPSEDREDGLASQLLERARVDGRAEDEGWRRRSDGSRIRVREILAPIRGTDDADLEVATAVHTESADGATGSTLEGYVCVIQDRTEAYERERELRDEQAFTESLFTAQPDLLYAYDDDENLIKWNDRFEQTSGYDSDDLEGMSPLEFIAPADRDRIKEAIERILEDGDRVTEEARILTADGARIPYEFNSARITDGTGSVLGFTGIGRDVSDRKARERELERLEQLNAAIRTIDETVVSAETRDEIERAIVEAFDAADPYQFVVICRNDTTGSTTGTQWEPQAWAGIEANAVDDVFSSFVGPEASDLGERAFETGAVERYHNLRESPIDERRVDARDRDYGSVAVVPIVASGRTFGLLLVAAAKSTAFTDREREVLQEYGGTIGHAINAMAVRRLLYLDTAIELEFESTDRRDVCVDCSARTGCRLSLDHVLPLTDEMFVYYVTVSETDSDRIETFAETHSSVSDFRRIDASNGDSHWEFVVQAPTITGLLAEFGARMRSQVVRDGVSSFTAQVSPDLNVRELVDAVTSEFPETTLVSKRTVERPVEIQGDFRQRVQAALTEKQRAALQAAYYGGYFEWPTRNSDASEIADRLGIARQTFHQHLRVAQAKLLTAYFGDGGEADIKTDS